LRSNDIELSEAVRKLRITVTQDNGKVLGYPTDPDNRNLAYSAYWGQALKQHCGAGILLPIVPIMVF